MASSHQDRSTSSAPASTAATQQPSRRNVLVFTTLAAPMIAFTGNAAAAVDALPPGAKRFTSKSGAFTFSYPPKWITAIDRESKSDKERNKATTLALVGFFQVLSLDEPCSPQRWDRDKSSPCHTHAPLLSLSHQEPHLDTFSVYRTPPGDAEAYPAVAAALRSDRNAAATAAAMTQEQREAPSTLEFVMHSAKELPPRNGEIRRVL